MKLLTLTSLAFFIPHFSVALEYSGLEIYSITSEACTAIEARDLLPPQTQRYDNFRAGISPSHRFNTLIMKIWRESLSTAFLNFDYQTVPLTYLALNSHPAVDRALSECYSQQEPREAFKKIFFADRVRSGRATSIAATGFSALAIHTLIARTATPLVATWIGRLALGGLAYGVYDLYDMHRRMDSEIKECVSSRLDRTSCLVQHVDDSLETLKALAPKGSTVSNDGPINEMMNLLKSESDILNQRKNQILSGTSNLIAEDELLIIESALALRMEMIAILSYELEN